MIKILVTGGNGQLGKCLHDSCERFSDKIEATFIDIEDLDIADIFAVKDYFSSRKFDWVINAAAYTAVDKAEEERWGAYRVNQVGAENIALASFQNKSKLIQISTDYVFDGTSETPYSTEELPNPQSVYGNTKAMGEQLAMGYNGETMIVRTAWLYSAYGHNFLKTMLRLGAEKSELNVVNDQHGTPTSAHDLADALIAIVLQNITIKEPTIYHYTNTGATTWFGFASKIMELAQLSCQVKPITTAEYPTAAQRPAYSVLDTSKMEKEFNLTIPSWEIGLEKTLKIFDNK